MDYSTLGAYSTNCGENEGQDGSTWRCNCGKFYADWQSRWHSNTSITDTLQAVLAKYVMVVVDSCFSGTLTRSVAVPEHNPSYLARMVEKRTRGILSSGGLEPGGDFLFVRKR